MCTWVGYIGPREAAVEVLEMQRRTEGLWGGAHSGLAVLDSDRKIRHAKVIGHTQTWLDRYSPDDFPGRIALAHTRTSSGGGREWGHPFATPSGALALVAQGSCGLFKAEQGMVVAEANRLLDAGYTFTTAKPPTAGRYPVLEDGTQVHSSEVRAFAADYAYRESRDHRLATAVMIAEMPSEAIYVLLYRDSPDRLWLANVNQRCVVGFASGEVFLATSALAFPSRVERIEEIPTNAVAAVDVDGVDSRSVHKRYEEVMEPPESLDEFFIEYLKDNPGTSLANVVDYALKPHYQSKGLRRMSTAGYRLLEKYASLGKVEITESVFQREDGNSAIRKTLSWRD